MPFENNMCNKQIACDYDNLTNHHRESDSGTRQNIYQETFKYIQKPYLKYFQNVILQPCCSAIPAETTLAEDPYKVPFPPKQAPNVKAQTNGCIGRVKYSLCTMVTTILTIIAVTGKLSRTDDPKADIHSIRKIAAASL